MDAHGQEVVYRVGYLHKIHRASHSTGWLDIQKHVRAEVSFTKALIIVRGKLHSRGESRRSDFILYHQPNLPIAVIEAKYCCRWPKIGLA